MMLTPIESEPVTHERYKEVSESEFFDWITAYEGELIGCPDERRFEHGDIILWCDESLPLKRRVRAKEFRMYEDEEGTTDKFVVLLKQDGHPWEHPSVYMPDEEDEGDE